MSNSAIPTPLLLSLSSLLPTAPFPPPDPLVQLATSLLAQSRQRAARLKPEEEVARTFACAHIACERLSNRLGLDVASKKDVKPPVPPRVYTKLKGFLEGILGSQPQTQQQSVAHAPRIGATTPRKADADAPVQTPPTASALGKRARENGEESLGFAMPMIRHICRACGLPSAAPHVFVGASTVAKEIASRAAVSEAASKRRRRTPQSSQRNSAAETTPNAAPAATNGVPLSKWPALIIAMTLITAAKMLTTELDDEKITGLRPRAINAMTAYCQSPPASALEAGSLPLDSLAEKLPALNATVGFYLLEAEDSGWMDMEWYENILPATDQELDESAEDAEDDGIVSGEELEVEEEDEERTVREEEDTVLDDLDDADDDDAVRSARTPLRRKERRPAAASQDEIDDMPGPAGLQPGLATMFQPAVDWLSAARRSRYAAWRKSILRKIPASKRAIPRQVSVH